jgi:lysyl-tRNA synthetase, class II
MAINEIRKNRIAKIKRIETLGFSCYPVATQRTCTNQEALKQFKSLQKEKKELFLVGRIRAQRGHGKASFIDMEDGTASIQVFLRQDALGEKLYKYFIDNFDVGDFVQVKGTLFLTKKKEKTLAVSNFKMLSKSVLPLPEKWHGLKDEEDRFRKRYLDILFSPEVKEMIQKKAVFWNSTREFLSNKGFLEVETPVLETTAGGADARPFETYHNALDMKVYLRISMGELWQKKLMVAGFEKTFEIGRQFRNEGMDAEHLQDYTQMEFYWAYADYKQGMALVEEMYRYVARKTFGTLKFKIRDFDVDLSKKWERYDYQTIISHYTGIDISSSSFNEMVKKLDKLNIKYDKKGFNKGRAIDSLWKYCRKKIAGPGFLINVPVEVSPLAKRNEKNPETTARFQVIFAGSEMGNGYSELNDPIDQAERFAEQQKLRDKGDEEAQMFDHDFVEALEYGMPPTCGFGLSERVFSFLMNKTARECQTFPLMKKKEKK